MRFLLRPPPSGTLWDPRLTTGELRVCQLLLPALLRKVHMVTHIHWFTRPSPHPLAPHRQKDRHWDTLWSPFFPSETPVPSTSSSLYSRFFHPFLSTGTVDGAYLMSSYGKLGLRAWGWDLTGEKSCKRWMTGAASASATERPPGVSVSVCVCASVYACDRVWLGVTVCLVIVWMWMILCVCVLL